MFIKHGDGKIISIIKSNDLEEEKKKSSKDLTDKSDSSSKNEAAKKTEN